MQERDADRGIREIKGMDLRKERKKVCSYGACGSFGGRRDKVEEE